MLDHTDLKSMLADTDLLRDRAFAAGEWVAAASGKSFPVSNPARGDVICTVPDLDAAEVARAIEAADEARRGWAAKTGKERAAVLRKWYEQMVANADDLAAILTAEMGKPLAAPARACGRGAIVILVRAIPYLPEGDQCSTTQI
jgi:succinate-semialdehyde dehydrogenase/glutarate-semialdehyde dehydrogenase